MAESFDPYHLWLGIPPAEQPPDHYRLLGVERFEASAEVISHAADRQMAHLRTFQAGRHSALSQQLLNAVSAARLALLDPPKKAAYDATLRQALAERAAASPAPAATGEADGSAFGQYVLLDRLAASRTGPVFKARHRTMQRTVAIKILSLEAAATADTLERFRRKVRILAALSHPNIVAAFDAGEMDGIGYLVMEYVDGCDLARLVKLRGPLPLPHAVNYAAQAAAGLAYAHQQGVHHRNVKPGNLLLDKQGVVKVIGLGLAGLRADGPALGLAGGGQLTATGQIMGTYDYMAPEQAVDTHAADHRADVYSLGCTLFHLLTGRPPYAGKTPMQQIVAHRNQPIPSLCAARNDAPPALDAVFRKLVAKDPAARYQAMSEVIAALSGT
jgi:serine/threonine protein kinase